MSIKDKANIFIKTIKTVIFYKVKITMLITLLFKVKAPIEDQFLKVTKLLEINHLTIISILKMFNLSIKHMVPILIV